MINKPNDTEVSFILKQSGEYIEVKKSLTGMLGGNKIDKRSEFDSIKLY